MSLLIEGRIEDFKKKFQQKFGKEIDGIVSQILPKYLNWVGKNLTTINFETNFPKLVTTLRYFEKISHNLPLTDINSYKSIEHLFEEISKYKNRQRRQIKKHQGANIIYDDGKFVVVNPLTHESSCFYGKGTKWCTAASTEYSFTKYNTEGKLFYILDRTISSDDPFYKVSLLKNFDGSSSWWDSTNTEFHSGWILRSPKEKEISETINDYMNSEFSEQIKIFKDKELAKKERERIERLRIERDREQKTAGVEQRRNTGEWELGPDCPLIGIQAHAVLLYLEDTGSYEIQTKKDKDRIYFLKNEIENLNTQFEQSEDSDTALPIIDEIENLEIELEELEEKLDVYDIIPLGSHYEMQTFEILQNPDQEFAVGDGDEIQKSCESYVEGLIDDIGYKGFQQSFAEQFIDKDYVKTYAREFYEEDVYQNPEIYLSDDLRQLSPSQSEKVEINYRKISQLKAQIKNLETILNDIEEENPTIEDKISDIEGLIEELEEEIEDIDSSPEGDYPDDKLEDKVEDLINEVSYNPIDWLHDFGIDWENFIDKEEFIKGVVDSDGYGMMNFYDGSYEEYKVLDQWFYVMRIN